MRILVYPHDMAIGGSQLNAVDLAAAVHDRGHWVGVIGQPGSLQSHISERGLEFIELPPPGRRPSPRVIGAIRKVAEDRNVDVIHGYEWPPALEAAIASRGRRATAVATVLSMSVAPFIPYDLPLLVGTEQILEVERSRGRTATELMEPPIDITVNSPEADLNVGEFATKWGLDTECMTVVIVSRLANEMKLEGILTAMDAVGSLRDSPPVQLLIVGTGPAAEQVRRLANKANQKAGRRCVILAGEMQDPRCAYAVADVVLGMGSSALRGMAFGKPVIVQGESGYWRTVTERSLPDFLWQGWYGAGPEASQGASRLLSELGPLLRQEALRNHLGEFSLLTLRDRFSLDAAAERQIDFYDNAISHVSNGRGTLAAEVAAGTRFVAYKGARLLARLRRATVADDFNARPVARTAPDDPRTVVAR
ncbi:glycosyltransferase [Arthrobacter sp. JSM 101049]|uniref:glycosyltransferase n=1 Tax=Arthrobacter sp. JSM 101049 TaxID=929097 RepID=UPI0035674291